MQSIWTARVAEAASASEMKDSAETCCLPLVEYLLTVSPQALYHSTNLYTKAGRVLAGKGILCYPDTTLHHLLILVPASMHSEQGMQTILSWITPLLPPQPAPKKLATAKQAKTAAAAPAAPTPWTMLLKYVSRAGNADEGAAVSSSASSSRKSVAAGQREGWTVKVEMKSSGGFSGKNKESDAVSDAIIQACINHAARLVLNSQGWALVGSRFLRIPANLEPSNCVPAIQLCLTLTQQSEMTIYMSSSLVRFNSVLNKSTHTEERYAEAIVRVLPDLREAQIQHVAGIASVGNSLGVDREMWLERHGITLPPSFPVVQVKLGVDDACYNFPTATLPLCCCLTSDLLPVPLRSRDEATKLKMAQDQTASIQEVLAILKGVRIVAPSTCSGGALINLLHSFEAHETDSLLEAIDPFASKRIASSETISADTGFQKASALAAAAGGGDTDNVPSKKRKFGVKLSIPQKRARASASTNELSLAFVKSTTQLPSAAPVNFGSAWDAPKTAPAPAAAASISKHGADAEMEPVVERPPKKATMTVEKKVASTVKLAASKPAASATAGSKPKKPKKETEAERAVRKAREKTEKAAAKAAAKAASKKRSEGWAADFQEAFAEEVSNPSAVATSADFKLAMGSGVAPVALTAAAAKPTKKAAS